VAIVILVTYSPESCPKGTEIVTDVDLLSPAGSL